MDKSDWTLLAIAAARGDALTPIQLQKALFLMGKTMPAIELGNFYVFKPYNYGPFSQAIYADAERLAQNGFIEIFSVPNQTWSNYRATQEGITRAKELLRDLDEAQVQYLEHLIQWIRNLGFEELLSFIYSQFPDFAVNSMFRVKQ